MMSEETGSAGLLLRTAARVIDFILIAAALEMLPRAGYFAGLAYLLLGDGFFDGRSIGKRLVKIRVVNTERNTACSIRDSILRNSPLALGFSLWVLPWVGWIFVVAAVVMEFILMLGSENGARLGDEIAKTAVLESDGKYDMREA